MKDYSKQRTQGVMQQFGVSLSANTRSTGADSPQVDYNNLLNKPTSSASPVYSGSIIDNGSTAAPGTPFPTGWSVSRTSAGVIKVTHNLGTTSYVVIPTTTNGAESLADIDALATNTFTIGLYDPASGSRVDCNSAFILTTQANP